LPGFHPKRNLIHYTVVEYGVRTLLGARILMTNNILVGLVGNAVLLLSLGLIYDVAFRGERTSPFLHRLISGLVIGGIAIVLMLTPVRLSQATASGSTEDRSELR
jgi:hypothetical protein